MKRIIRGLAFRTAAGALVASSFLAAPLVAGCAASPPPRPAAAAKAPSRGEVDPAAEQRATLEAREQRDAQRAWCVYLEALYLRAAEHADAWPKFHQCASVTTMASPRMLRATAECSLKALRRFEGDPFTSAYAAEVSKCGSDAMDSTSLPPGDLAPYMNVLCGRVAACGQLDYDACRAGLEEGLGAQLERAIGAMNARGRSRVRACFQSMACAELGSQITACLEPIMSDLLWLPG